MKKRSKNLFNPLKFIDLFNTTRILKRSWIFLLFFVIHLVGICNYASAQQVTVTGTVKNQNGEPVTGATVLVKGTTSGVLTDAKGTYTMRNVPPNSTLVFTFIGMAVQEIALDGRTAIDVVMGEQAVGLGEVVVTALGLQTEKKALGYNTTTVKSSDLVVAHQPNFTNALQGKVAGAKISTFTSKPGSALQIILRGGSSIMGNNEPLFVVNGIPFDAANFEFNSGINDIDPNSIESVDILRGAAASALYGSKAANGVVLITTKSGTFNSKPTITIQHASSWDNAIQMDRNSVWAQGVWDQDQQKNVYYDGNTQFTPFSFGPRIKDVPGAKVYDTYKMGIFKTAYTHDNTVSIQGGGANSTYYVSVNNLNNSGVVPQQVNFQRQSVNANTSFKFTDKLTVSTNFTYTRQGGLQSDEGWTNKDFMNTFLMEPLTWNPYPYYDDNGNPRSYRGGGRDQWNWILDNVKKNVERNRAFGTVVVEYKFGTHLKFRSTTGLSMANTEQRYTIDWGGIFTTKESSEVTWNTSFRRDVQTTNLLMYNNKFGDFKLDAIFGLDAVSYYTRNMMVSGTPLIIPHIFMLSNTGNRNTNTSLYQARMFSLLGEARLSYKDMLYYTLTGRNDWPSTLENNYFYSSHSLGFIFSQLISDKSILNFGKVRASFAKVGSPAQPYANNTTLTTPNTLFIYWPFNGQQSYLPSDAYPNPSMTNEEKNEIEWGVNLDFFQSRLGVEFTQYHNWSENQIVWSPMLAETGYNGGDVNIGGITHKGIEITLTGVPVKTKNFSWDVYLTWSQDNSKVDALGPTNAPVSVGWEGAAIVGYPFPMVYGEALLKDENGNLIKSDEGDQENRTLYGDWLMDPTGSKPIAKIMPDWTGGLRNTFTYKRLSLSALLTAQQGGHVYSLLAGYFERFGMDARWDDRPDDNRLVLPGVMGHFDYATQKVVVSDPNPSNDVWTRFDNHSVNDYWNHERCTQPTDYIRLKELAISYDLPVSVAKKAFMKGMRISASGVNLWRKFHKDFYSQDPEFITAGEVWGSPEPKAGNAVATFGFPPNKTYTISVNITF